MSRELYGPAADRITPIPIREDVTVCILDIPHDLTKAEAEKIVAVVKAVSGLA